MADKRFAILIASSRFPEEPSLTELRCPENDVDALNEILSSPELGGFEEPLVLKNEPSYKILEQLETVLREADGKDLVLVYFSGHGKTSCSMSGQLFFATTNTKLKTPRSTSVSAAEIKALFDDSPAKRKILLLDCCYSGAVGKEFTKGGIDGELQLLSGRRGTFIMTASTSFQAAFEKEGDQHGLFTKHLLEGIRSGEADDDDDGWIDMAELFGYVRDKMKEEGGQQEPLQWHLEGDGKLFISRSGTESWEKRTQAAKMMLFELAAQERLSENIVVEAVQLLSIPKREMSEKDQVCSLLIDQLAKGKLKPSLFTEQWLRICFAHNAAPPPQKGRTIGQYIDHGDGTVTDTKTGLMWKRCLEGLSGENCEEGKVKEYTWNEAVKRFKDFEYAGYADWRLPTIDELKTLVQCSKGKDKKGNCKAVSKSPTINQQAFPNTEASYVWSGSPRANLSVLAWNGLFYYGYSGYYGRSYYYAVRLVRGGQ